VSKCPAHGGEFRKGVLVTLLVPGKGLRGARVCQDCANGGMIVVAPKLPPVKVEKVARPNGYENTLRQLRALAVGADAMTEDDPNAAGIDDYGECRYQEGRRDAYEGSIELVKREMGQ
jgi:hypothetical protein